MKYAIIIEDTDTEFLKVLKENWKPGKVTKIKSKKIKKSN